MIFIDFEVNFLQDETIKTKTPGKCWGFFVEMDGLEPPTHGFSVRCSTN